MRRIFTTNPLFKVFFIPVIVDIVGTVTGQSSSYWSSNYQNINEAAPVFVFLQMSPWLFIVATLAIWLFFTYWLTKKLGSPYNLWITLTLFAGHSYNSVYWLRNTQKNLGILEFGSNHALSSLSLIPMFIYLFLIGWIAAKSILEYYKK